MRVLVVEDNEILARNIIQFLTEQDIFAELSIDGKDGLHKLKTKYYDVVLLDINLPGLNGLEICKQTRELEIDIAIIMLTLLGTNDDIINGLNEGADDYIPKPFDYDILIARINAVLRRRNVNKSNTLIKHKNIELNLKKSEVKIDGNEITFSKLEYDLLKFFMQNIGVAFSRAEIYEKVWGEFDIDFSFSKTIDVYVGYLRKKIGKETIKTKTKFGFIMD